MLKHEEESFWTKVKRALRIETRENGFVELKSNGASYVDPDKLFSEPEGKRRLKRASGSLDALEEN